MGKNNFYAYEEVHQDGGFRRSREVKGAKGKL